MKSTLLVTKNTHTFCQRACLNKSNAIGLNLGSNGEGNKVGRNLIIIGNVAVGDITLQGMRHRWFAYVV